MSNSKSIFIAELTGILFTILLGSFFHFTYDISGGNSVVALFSAVNESTWEHMKLLFFPYLIYTIYEFFQFREEAPNFFTAKAIGAVAGLVMIPLLFYGYTYLLGRNYAILDILVFVLSVITAYGVSYALQRYPVVREEGIAVGILIIIAILFFVFTFVPPNCFLFIDPIGD